MVRRVVVCVQRAAGLFFHPSFLHCLEKTLAIELEKFALATRLHVLLRRKTGRVTDVEWMMSDPAYAAEVVRLGQAPGDAELADLAGKWATACAEVRPGSAQRQPPRGPAARAGEASLIVLGHDGRAQSVHAVQERYVGRLR